MKPRRTLTSLTSSMTPVELATVSSTTVGACPGACSALACLLLACLLLACPALACSVLACSMPRNSTSQCGTRCSAIVWLAAIASRCDTPDLIDRSPASSRSAASSTSSAQPTMRRPCSVRWDPPGERTSRVTFVARSSVRILADSACCETPSAMAAAAMDPRLPTSRSARSAPRSCTASLIAPRLPPVRSRLLLGTTLACTPTRRLSFPQASILATLEWP